MIDLNYSIRVAYYSALSGITGVPVYYQSVPNDVSPQNYIVFRSITNNEASTKNSSDTNTTVTVEIHTFQDVNNPGLNNDTIARDVYNRIYANGQFNLTIDGGQIVHTMLSSDDTQDFVMNGGRAYISRFITFKHKIFQTADIS